MLITTEYCVMHEKKDLSFPMVNLSLPMLVMGHQTPYLRPIVLLDTTYPPKRVPTVSDDARGHL